ncbi:MAG: tetratricopeptide repeat protein [Geobacter sp.]|nr:tetratricopeptide repeat protein [Geobacter sp.]
MVEQNELQVLLEKGELDKARELCLAAIEQEPGKSVHYLNLGRIYVRTGRKREAIRTFRDGLLFENNQRIVDELTALGWRDLPVFPSLGREHWLNRLLGRIRSLFS